MPDGVSSGHRFPGTPVCLVTILSGFKINNVAGQPASRSAINLLPCLTLWFAKTPCDTLSGPCNIVTSRSDVKPGTVSHLWMLLIAKDRRLDGILANDNRNFPAKG